jgi:putative pyruvate formate lyase activating enzyme
LKTKNGVGNIFFGNCNLKCVFCQNYQISQNHLSEANFVVSKESLANIILEFQGKNVNSIGFVSPTHFIPQIIEAIELASKKGLNLPLIYNTNCYDSPEIIEYLNGIFHIYLPDFKYSDDKFAKKYSNAKGYFELAKKNIIKMYEQVGSELIIEDNILKRGLIIRHLILPNDIAGSYEILKFISGLDKNISISLMSQYYPAYKAKNFDLISRNISESEYNRVLDWMDELGLENGFVQDFDSKDYYIPDFENRNQPFKR